MSTHTDIVSMKIKLLVSHISYPVLVLLEYCSEVLAFFFQCIDLV